MKKVLLLLIPASVSAAALAQEPNRHNHADSLLSRWVVDLNLLGGLASQTFTTANTAGNYLNGLNINTGQLTYTNGSAFGGDAQLGFFFGKKRHFGLGTGIMYMEQNGDAVLNNYHVEYQATDGNGNIYRQVVTGNDLKEAVKSTNINIPLVLKYKTRFSKHWGFTADAGALFNVQMQNAYTTGGSFDYEAIYKFTQSDGGTTSIYDNSPTPSVNDWMITKAEFLKNNPNGNLQDYFNAKRALGFNVGDGLAPGTHTGTTSYTAGSIGFLVQPSINYYLSNYVALNFGVYYMVQPFKNNAQSNYRLTDGINNYSSVLNNVTASTNQSYGLNAGVRFFFCKKHPAPLVITSIDQSSPSQCSLCDGSMALRGLTPNVPVTVDYSLNGAPATKFVSTVDDKGQVNIPNLCAGTYTGIAATIRRKTAIGTTVTLADPVVNITSQNPANPSAPGICDGAVKFSGLNAGKSATINYNLNGSPQTPFTGNINPDNSITINNLCEGKYTGIIARVNNCTANGTDFTLVAPAPPAPAPPAPPAEDMDISEPILFDFNKTTVHKSSYPELEKAAEIMKEDKTKTITINGYTDIIGTKAYNKVLSVKRAKAVKKDLTKLGINPRRLKTVGHGANSPIESNKTAEGRHEDRRAVMDLEPKGK